MKRIQTIVGLLAIATLSSCSIKEGLLQPESMLRVRAVIEQPGTVASTKVYVDKVEFDESKKYKLYWYKNDAISVFHENTYNRQLIFKGRDGQPGGDFDEIPHSADGTTYQDLDTPFHYAVFPYHEYNSCDDGTLTVVIPDRQEYYSYGEDGEDYRGIGARLLMVAKNAEGNNDFFFKHVASYIGVRLKGENLSVKSLTLRGNKGETVAGYPLVTFDENDDPVMTFDPRDRDNSSFITMELTQPKTLNKDEFENFWFIVPPISFAEGFIITVEDERGRTRDISVGQMALERKKFYRLEKEEIDKWEDWSDPVVPVTYTLDIEPAEDAEVNAGSTLDFKLTLTTTTNGESETSDVTDNATWTSGDTTIATIDDGIATGVKEGNVTITAKYTTPDGVEKTLTAPLKVNKKSNQAGDNVSVGEGGTFGGN